MLAPVDRRALLEHADFVRAVARRLLDEHRADDVVQETMLAALQRQATLRDDMRGWLATVARNFARMSLRGEARRTERERYRGVATPADTPDAVAARLETQRRIVDAVRALPETYRIAVTLRFFEGLSPGEIARRQGVPVKTVHTRLRRAFERLRDRLDGDHGGDGRAWALALVPLVPATSARWVSAASAKAGALLVNLKIPAMLLVVAAAFVVASDGLSSDSVPRSRRVDDATTRGRELETTSGKARSETPIDTRADKKSARIGTVRLEGKLVYSVAGTREPARVSVYRVSSLDLRTGKPAAVESARDRTFELDVSLLVADTEVSTLELQIDQPRHLTKRLRIAVVRGEAGARLEPVTVALRPAAVVRGEFVGPDGRPVVDAFVALFREEGGAPVPPAVDTAKAGPDGRYQLRAPDGGRHIVVVAADEWGPTHVRVNLGLGAVTDAEALRARKAGALGGKVTVNGELPRLGRIRVEAVAEEPRGKRLSFRSLSWLLAGPVRTRASTDVSAADGAFSIGGLEPGRYAVRVSHIDDAHLDLANTPGVPAMAPFGGVRLDLAVAYVDVMLRPPAGGAVAARGRATTERVVDGQGRLRLVLVPGQPYILRATQTGFETTSRVVNAPATGDAVTVVIDLAREAARSTLRVRLRGKVPPHAGFALFRPGASHPSVQRTVRASDGVFQLDKLPPGTWRVEIHPGASYYHPLSHYLRIEKQIDLREGATETIELEARAGGRLRLLPQTPRGEPARCQCEILDSTGRRAGVRFYIPASGGWQHSDSRIGPAPTEVGPALPPGRYRLRIFGEAVVERNIDVDLEEGKTSELVVPVQRP